MIKTIRDIIGENREPFSVDLNLSLQKAIEYMREMDIRAVAVCDKKDVVGVFSERDVLRNGVLEELDLTDIPVRDIMSSPAYWISMDERCDVAKAIMVKKRCGHLVVLDEARTFRGFVSSQELLESDLVESRNLVGKLNDEYFAHNLDTTS